MFNYLGSNMDIKLSWKKRLLWIPPLFLGVLALLLAPYIKQAPSKVNTVASAKVVRVIDMQPRRIQPTAIGYGYIHSR